jgi:hypothetical protein
VQINSSLRIQTEQEDIYLHKSWWRCTTGVIWPQEKADFSKNKIKPNKQTKKTNEKPQTKQTTCRSPKTVKRKR